MTHRWFSVLELIAIKVTEQHSTQAAAGWRPYQAHVQDAAWPGTATSDRWMSATGWHPSL